MLMRVKTRWLLSRRHNLKWYVSVCSRVAFACYCSVDLKLNKAMKWLGLCLLKLTAKGLHKYVFNHVLTQRFFFNATCELSLVVVFLIESDPLFINQIDVCKNRSICAVFHLLAQERKMSKAKARADRIQYFSIDQTDVSGRVNIDYSKPTWAGAIRHCQKRAVTGRLRSSRFCFERQVLAKYSHVFASNAQRGVKTYGSACMFLRVSLFDIFECKSLWRDWTRLISRWLPITIITIIVIFIAHATSWNGIWSIYWT